MCVHANTVSLRHCILTWNIWYNLVLCQNMASLEVHCILLLMQLHVFSSILKCSNITCFLWAWNLCGTNLCRFCGLEVNGVVMSWIINSKQCVPNACMHVNRKHTNLCYFRLRPLWYTVNNILRNAGIVGASLSIRWALNIFAHCTHEFH